MFHFMLFAIDVCANCSFVYTFLENVIVSFCVLQTVGFVWGYICQQFSQTILILLAGFVLACLVCTFVDSSYPVS